MEEQIPQRGTACLAQAGSWQTAEPAALFAGAAAAPKPQCGPCKNGGHLMGGFFQGSSHLSRTQGTVGMAGIPQRGSGAEQLDHRDMKTCLSKTLKNLNTGTESSQEERLIIPLVGQQSRHWQLRNSLTFLFVHLPSFVGTTRTQLPAWQEGGWHCSPGKSNPAGFEGSWREPGPGQAVLGAA